MAENTEKQTFWQRIGSRKFIVYMLTNGGIVLVAWLVKDPVVAGVILGALILNRLIYCESNVRAKFKLGDSTIETGGNGGNNVENG